MAGPSSSREVAETGEHLHHEQKRVEFSLKRKQEQLEKNVKKAFINLQEKCNQAKRRILTEWAKDGYTDQVFPGAGKDVAYSVPPVFFNHYELEREPGTGGGYVSKSQDSDVRCDKAERLVTRAFTILNNQWEQNSIKPMFLIGNCLPEHILKWPEKIEEVDKQFADNECPDMVVNNRKPKYYGSPEPGQKRTETDLLILHQDIGVILVEVKAFGTESGGNPDQHKKEIYNKFMKAKEQLDKREEVFRTIMDHIDLSAVAVHKVVGLPFVDTTDALTNYGVPEEDRKGVHLLLGKDLFEEDKDKAEDEYDLSALKKWWTGLHRTSKTLSDDNMKDIIARYIGTLSTPRKFDAKSEKHHVRTLGDAVRLTAKLFTRLVLTKPRQVDLLKAADKKRVHLKGPPGSGKTTMLILKARKFLEENGEHSNGGKGTKRPLRQKTSKKTSAGQSALTRHVFVIDVHTEPRGRLVGYYIHHSLNNERCHHLLFNQSDTYSEEKLVEKVKNYLPGKRIASGKSLMFVIADIRDDNRRENVLKVFETHDQLKNSVVWYADGLVAQKSSESFSPETLKSILRIPPSVQAVMYHADDNAERNVHYTPDSGKLPEIPTNGPPPLCVRHQNHKKTRDSITNCTDCADELIDLLENKIKLMDDIPCSISILANLPLAEDQKPPSTSTKGTKQGASRDTSGRPVLLQRRDDEMGPSIGNCQFITQLKSKSSRITLTVIEKISPRKIEMIHEKGNWNKILVSEAVMMQGLERDVVVFLPNDRRGEMKDESSRKESGQMHTRSMRSQTSSRDSPSPPKSSSPQRSPAGEASTSSPMEVESAESTGQTHGLAKYHWRARDIERYTYSDKKSLVAAASQCRSQLIMLIP